MKKIAILSFICLSIGILCKGQSNTMYYMEQTPQVYYTNPASQPYCNFYLGMPILSPIQAGFYNKGFNTSDLFDYDVSIDSFTFLLHPNKGLAEFVDGLDKVNHTNIDVAANIASFGFRVNEMYFTFDYTLKMMGRLTFTKDFYSLSLQGPGNGEEYNLSPIGPEMTAYSEIAIGIAKNFDHDLSIGIRPKILFGIFTLYPNEMDISLKTSVEEWELHSKLNYSIATPGVVIPTDSAGAIDPNEPFEIDDNIGESSSDYSSLITKNFGLGVDIGAHYRPTDYLELSLSILDLGFIKWNNGYTHTISQDGTYIFDGVDVEVDDSTDMNTADRVIDTIKKHLEVTGSDDGFTSYLYTKILFGGRYYLSDAFDLGIITRLNLYKGTVDPDVSILMNWRPSQIWSVALNYTLFDGSYSNIGIGSNFRLGPFNWYFIFDGIPILYNDLHSEETNTIPYPRQFNSFAFKMGFNLVFGCNKLKRLLKDKPMYYTTDY